jgi:hypothetical protein
MSASVVGAPNLSDHVLNIKNYKQILPVIYAQDCYDYLPGTCDAPPSQGYNPDPTLNPENEPNLDDEIAPPQGEGDEIDDTVAEIECVIDDYGEEHCPPDMQQLKQKKYSKHFVCNQRSPYDRHCPPYSGYWKYKGSNVYIKVRKLY